MELTASQIDYLKERGIPVPKTPTCEIISADSEDRDWRDKYWEYEQGSTRFRSVGVEAHEREKERNFANPLDPEG